MSQTIRYMAMLFVVLFVSMTTMAQSSGQVQNDARRRGLPNLPSFDHKAVHFGFLIGFNALDFHIYNTGIRTLENGEKARYGEIQKLNPGINLGIVTDFRICEHLNFRCLPGVGFGQRDISFIDEYGQQIGDPLKIKSTFVEMPLLLKYGSNRLRNVRPFVVGGLTPRYDLAKDKQDHLVLKSLDCYWDAGAGVDFYLPYFRFSFEVRGSFGLANVKSDKMSDDLEDLPYQQAIDRLKSRIVCFTFYFE